MRAIELTRPGNLVVREVPIPTPGTGEVLIRIRAATTCGTDLKAYRRGHPQIPMPGPFGHEYAGSVSAIGEGAKFSVGQDVMGVHSAPCGECPWCVGGQDNLCATIMESKVLGSYAEYLLIPRRIAERHLFLKPESLPFSEAALLEPLACVAQAVLKLGLIGRTDLSVLIIGPGAIGLLFVAALRHEGFKQITLAGRNQERLAVGRQLGASTVAYPAEVARGGFDVVIECTGQPEVWEQTVDWVRRGGSVLLFGGCPGGTRVSFDTNRLHYDQIDVLNTFHFGTNAVLKAIDWLAGENPLALSALLSGERQLEQAEETFADLERGIGLKYVFKP